MPDYRLDPPDPSECPRCGEEFWPDDGPCTCGYKPLDPEDIADAIAERRYQLLAEGGA